MLPSAPWTVTLIEPPPLESNHVLKHTKGSKNTYIAVCMAAMGRHNPSRMVFVHLPAKRSSSLVHEAIVVKHTKGHNSLPISCGDV
jgi:hypothetical protein